MLNNLDSLLPKGRKQVLCRANAAIKFAFFALILSSCGSPTQPEAEVNPTAQPQAAVTPGVVITTPAEPVDPEPIVTPTVAATPIVTVTPEATATTSPATVPPTSDLLGEKVDVSTKVQRVITPNVFTVYDKESLRGQEVLVVSKQKAPPVGTNIELTGVVRNFNVAEANQNYGLNISQNQVQQYANKPYIAAEAFEKVD